MSWSESGDERRAMVGRLEASGRLGAFGLRDAGVRRRVVGRREAGGRRAAVTPVGRRTPIGHRALAGLIVVAAMLTAGCGASAAKPSAAGPSPATDSSAASGTPSTGSPAPATPGSTTPAAPATSDPGTLPQTHELPAATDPTFLAGARALFQAIVDDDPAEAQSFFFPQTAYVQVKAIPDPVADYQHRLIGFYDLDIHAAHRLLGADAKNARFVSVSVPTAAAKWITPGVEANKGSYYRVYGSRLIYQVGGHTKSFGLFSLISWRGVWYVVHLGPNPRPKPVGAVYQPQG